MILSLDGNAILKNVLLCRNFNLIILRGNGMYNTKNSNISFAKELLLMLLISKIYVISLCTYLVYVY